MKGTTKIAALLTAMLVNMPSCYGGKGLRGRERDVAIELDEHSRHLKMRKLGMVDFEWLDCNANLDTATCVSWTETFGTEPIKTSRVLVDCGQCITMDHPGPELVFQDGIDIRGKLVFPDNYSLTVQSNMIAVQGELKMTSSKPIDGNPLIKFIMTGQADEYFTPISQNAGACGGGDCKAGKKAIVIAGGRMNVNGFHPDTPTWLRLYDVIGPQASPTGIVVADTVKGKWLPGAEIVVTSHTRDWWKQQERTIIGVTDHAAGYVEIELDLPLTRPTTVVESPEYAVEVALLSRNIVFEGGVDTEAHHGGHMWVMHTPLVQQRIEGIEVKNFGQQTSLGRYPIHFHLCGDVSGSVVRKNTIRQSNQRCVVVHGTNNLLIEDNIAYDTKGHCFILEDGLEHGNQFIGNLGALQRPVENIIPNLGSNGLETDDHASTFWITNPNNSWKGNVAAGAQDSGFWFELRLRGPLKDMFPDLVPKRENLGLFEDNVAHSNGQMGVRTYPNDDFKPGVQAVFKDLKIYRNTALGFQLHVTKDILIVDSLFADNGVGIDVDRADLNFIRDTTIIGISDSYASLMASQGEPSPCYRQKLVGLEHHTYAHWYGNPVSEVENVQFLNFEDPSCEIATPIMLDNAMDSGMFSAFSTFKGVVVDGDGKNFDFCLASNRGILAYFTDLDGGLSPIDSPTTTTSAAITNAPNMLHFVDTTRCTEYADRCYSYCEDVGFRTVWYNVDPADTETFRLRVCKRDDPSNCAYFEDNIRHKDSLHHDEHWSNRDRWFAAHLPGGQYDIAFVDESGALVWPSYADEKLQSDNYGPGAWGDGDIQLLKPPLVLSECDELIRNGDMELSDSDPGSWLYRWGDLAVVPGAGVGGSNALYSNKRDKRATLLQYFDSRCVAAMEGRTFEIQAKVKVVKPDGSPYICDATMESCPTVGYGSSEGRAWNAIAQVGDGTDEDGFQSVSTSLVIDSVTARSRRSYFYIELRRSDLLMYVDDTSMRVVMTEEERCNNLISTLDSGYWQSTGSGSVQPEVGLDFTTSAIRYTGRRWLWNGPSYSVVDADRDLSCMERGSEWEISGKVKLVNSDDNEGSSCMMWWNCPRLRLEVKNSVGETVLEQKVRSYISGLWDANSFNDFKTTVAIPESGWVGEVDSVFVGIRDIPKNTDLILDGFSVRRVS